MVILRSEMQVPKKIAYHIIILHHEVRQGKGT